MSFFIGTASYVGTFVAQYYGAGVKARIGPAVWQESIFPWPELSLLTMIPFGRAYFQTGGSWESSILRQEEVIYFQYLCLGGFPVIAASALSGFFTGLGRPWPVMWNQYAGNRGQSLSGLRYDLRQFRFPEMGIKGAAIASVIAGVSSL